MSQFLDELTVSVVHCRERMEGGVYNCWEDVPEMYRKLIVQGDGGEGNYDYSGMLQKGKDWVVHPLEALQPRSFTAFQEAVGPLCLGIMLIKDLLRPGGPPLVQPVLFFDAAGRMVEVHPTFPGSTYEDANFPDSLLSLPEDLANSWLWRTRGWRMPSKPFQGPMVNRRLIGHPSSQWEPVEAILQSFDRLNWKQLMMKIRARFPDAVVTHYNSHDGSPHEWTSMRCFLDTRPADLSGPVGDQFFVFDEKRDQTVYHIHQGDIDDIRVLRNPSDAIDHYCAHVLYGIRGEFDFSHWSDPLVDL